MWSMIKKQAVKNLLGELPLTAEIYWHLFQHDQPVTRSFSLRKTAKRLPEWCAQAENGRKAIRTDGRRVLLFCTLRYWIEHAALLSVTLAGMGHQVTLAYLPYPSFNRPLSRFDIRRNNAYTHSVLKAASGIIQPLSLLDVQPEPPASLPSELVKAIREVSLRDTQYTLQVEQVDSNIEAGSGQLSLSNRLFHLRQERNQHAAAAALGWIQSLTGTRARPDQRPDVLITPNGSILEMGAVYQTARFLGIPAVTYEFGEQRGRIWLAQNSEVMLQETDRPLVDETRYFPD